MNIFEEFDYILASNHNYKSHSLLSGTVSKELFLAAEKLKQKYISNIKLEDLKILSDYFFQKFKTLLNVAYATIYSHYI